VCGVHEGVVIDKGKVDEVDDVELMVAK